MPRKERSDVSGQTSAKAATAAFFGIDEETVEKARRDYKDWAQADFDSAAPTVSPRTLRRCAYYRKAGRNPFQVDIEQAVRYPDGSTGVFLKTGDFEIYDEDEVVVYRSYAEQSAE